MSHDGHRRASLFSTADHPLPSPASASAHSHASSDAHSAGARPHLGHPAQELEHARRSRASLATTTTSDAPSLAGDEAPAPPSVASSSSSGSASSSSSSSAASHALPPPPVPLPAAYSHPSIPPTPRRRPLPAPPSNAARFVPLHPLPPPTSSSAKGKGRAEGPTAGEEKAALLARERGLDELFGGREHEGEEDAASPISPAGTELPDYAVSPFGSGGLRRSATAAKRAAGLREDEEGGGREGQKRALVEAEVRARVNADARRVVEDDVEMTKAGLARRAAEEERERAEGEEARRGREAEKRMEALRVEEEEEEDEEEPPPPISPEQDGRGMLPLVDRKEPLFDPPAHEARVPPPPLTSYRLPPPPVPAPTESYALPFHSNALPVQDDYFSQPIPPRPSLAPVHTAPLPPPFQPHRPEATRHATLASSSRSELYVGGLAASTSGARYGPPPDEQSRPMAARHGSLGPAHSFYSAGVGQVALKTLEARQQLAPPPARGTSSSPTSPVSPDFFPSTSPSTDSARSRASGHRASISWSPPAAAALAPPASFAQAGAAPYPTRSATASSSGSTAQYGVVSSPAGTPSLPSSTRLSASPQAYGVHPSPPAPHAFPAAQSAAPSPAFYTALTPGGPLLPFYAAPSSTPGRAPSYFSPAAAGALNGGLPPPPAQPVFASLPPTPAPAQAHALAQGAYPFPQAPATSPAPRAASAQDAARPWSRSSAGSPSLLGVEGGPGAQGTPAREKRMSTIRSLFGRKRAPSTMSMGGEGAALAGGGGGGGAGLAGTPEEEEGGRGLEGLRGWTR
ncbi:hypothetical protein JCM10449v2_007159 [Rhodotorula kratochvilovae]